MEKSEASKTDSAHVTEIAREVAKLARSILGESTEVIWFGSWPQERALPRSDIDVAVSTGAPVPSERLAVLQEAVEELPTLYEIDIVDLSSAGLVLRHEILKHGQRL
jgi:predicted nucleotidyltransferase